MSRVFGIIARSDSSGNVEYEEYEFRSDPRPPDPPEPDDPEVSNWMERASATDLRVLSDGWIGSPHYLAYMDGHITAEEFGRLMRIDVVLAPVDWAREAKELQVYRERWE